MLILQSKKGADDKYIRTFKRTDYIERERRNLEVNKVKQNWEDHLDEGKIQVNILIKNYFFFHSNSKYNIFKTIK